MLTSGEKGWWKLKFKIPKNQKKELFLSLTIIVIGNLLGIGMFLQENLSSSAQALPRKDFGQGAYEETLKISTDRGTEEIQITVGEQQYSSSQIQAYLREAHSFLSKWYLENISDTNCLRKDLDLPSSLPENPAEFFWSTDAPEILSWNGKLGEEIPEEGCQITLRCTLSIGENELVWEEHPTVFPPSLSDIQLLEKNIQREAEAISDETDKELLLPAVVDGTEINYQIVRDRDSWIICLLSLLLGLGIFPLAKEKEKQAQALRSRQMQRDYPDIIQKLILFLKAGLSIRKSMEKLAADYLKRKKAALTGTRYAYEELVKTCLEMERGVYEKEAYERLGRRCGLAEYKILSVLLVQNLKKGNQSILELLEREAVSAGEERLRRARIQGEEASAKLLLPMILQLLVVFIILMVPAFINFF